MAVKPLRPCRHPGCCVLVSDGYCETHKPRDRDQRSEESKAWRWMYSTDAWKLDLRPGQLLREPFCRECARQGKQVRATDVDHIVDHKGDWARFTDCSNLESLCHSCHSRKTAAELWKNSRKTRRR
jgi:5-methylcytosine-specific restriction protein A